MGQLRGSQGPRGGPAYGTGELLGAEGSVWLPQGRGWAPGDERTGFEALCPRPLPLGAGRAPTLTPSLEPSGTPRPRRGFHFNLCCSVTQVCLAL